MAYLSSLVLFCLACFAGEVVELGPVGATGISSNANVVCSAITTETTNYQTECNSLPGCTWKESSYTGGNICELDACWQYGENAQTASTTPVYPCNCTGNGIYTEQDTASCGTWQSSGFPPHTASSGTGKDFYCRRVPAAGSPVTPLPGQECSFQYLKNGSCPGPFCILVDHTTPEAGKVCKRLDDCKVSKLADPANAIRLNNADISPCLTARYAAGETTACNQNPEYFLQGNQCVRDPLYAPAADQDTPVCPTGAVVKQVNGISGGASVILNYCANSSNPVLNTCWHLTNVTVSGTNPNQCPVNPTPTATSLTENTALCTGDCFLQTISSFYYGYTKICVNSDSAGGHSSILVVPSLIALLLLAFFL